MKKSKLIIATVWVAVAALIWSCEDSNSVTPDITQEKVLSDNILIGSNSALTRLKGQGFGGPIGALYGSLLGGINGRVETTPRDLMNMAFAHEDSSDVDPACLTETWEDDGNGNFTYTLDFGDGCDFYGEFMKGKLVETGSYDENNFSSTVTYTNFGGEDWTINGTHSYSGTYIDESIIDEENPEDSIWAFSAEYEFSADINEEFVDYGYDEDEEVSTGETIVVVDYVASGSESMDENGYTIKTLSEAVEVNTGESFTAQVDVPLYFDFSCEDEDVWIFVSGIESGTYAFEDISGTYSIDFGDGTCDNIITITENGVSEDIDLEEEWEEWEEECDDHDGEDEDEDEDSDD